MIVLRRLNESRSQRTLWILDELRARYEAAFYRRDARTNLAQ
jgi:glutathione S-transferase